MLFLYLHPIKSPLIKMDLIDYAIKSVSYTHLDVYKRQPNACPPMVVGVGIGGTFEKCALMAKQALTRPLDDILALTMLYEVVTLPASPSLSKIFICLLYTSVTPSQPPTYPVHAAPDPSTKLE